MINPIAKGILFKKANELIIKSVPPIHKNPCHDSLQINWNDLKMNTRPIL